MTRQFVEDVYWINECFEVGEKHVHVGAYLVLREAGNLLVDTGSFVHRESIREGIDDLTDGEGIDGIVLTHYDLHHTGNTADFREAWGEVELYAPFVGSAASPEVLGMGSGVQYDVGGTTEVVGRRLSFPVPPLALIAHSTWVFDHATATLFPADGFGHYHDPGDCDRLSSEFADGIPREDVADFHRDTLRWLRFVDPERLSGALSGLVESYGVERIAPIHGNPIDAGDLGNYRETLDAVIEDVAGSFEPGMGLESRLGHRQG